MGREPSRREMAEWDNEYFDHMDHLIQEDVRRQVQGTIKMLSNRYHAEIYGEGKEHSWFHSCGCWHRAMHEMEIPREEWQEWSMSAWQSD